MSVCGKNIFYACFFYFHILLKCCREKGCCVHALCMAYYAFLLSPSSSSYYHRSFFLCFFLILAKAYGTIKHTQHTFVGITSERDGVSHCATHTTSTHLQQICNEHTTTTTTRREVASSLIAVHSLIIAFKPITRV